MLKRVLKDQMQLKNLNRISLLNYIRNNKNATKASLAEMTGLTFMAIKKNLEELMELGFIREDGFSGAAVGRRSITYRINEDYAYTVGVHINMFETRAAVMDLMGNIRHMERLDMAGMGQTSAAFIPALVRLVKQAVENCGLPAEKLVGMGIGAPGPVDPVEGVVLSPPNMPQLSYIPIRRIMEEETGLATFLQKDTNVLALGERWKGAAKGYDDVLYIDADIGIGSGILIGGSLYQGVNSGAGEVGHMSLDEDGPLCNCGGHGCLEALASGLSIVRKARDELAHKTASLLEKAGDLSVSAVFRAANANDPLAITLMNESAHYMGIAVGNVMNLLDPQIVVIGGVLAHNYEPYVSIVRQTASSRRIQNFQKNQVVRSLLAEEAGVVGAGEIVTQCFFSDGVNHILSLKNAVE